MYEIELEQPKSFLKCSICRSSIKREHRIVKLAVDYGIICLECDKKFDNEEIELMSNIFTAFGGYFGSNRDNSKSSSYQIIKKLSSLYKEKENEVDLSILDIKVLHQALLQGISPKQIFQGLKLISE